MSTPEARAAAQALLDRYEITRVEDNLFAQEANEPAAYRVDAHPDDLAALIETHYADLRANYESLQSDRT